MPNPPAIAHATDASIEAFFIRREHHATQRRQFVYTQLVIEQRGNHHEAKSTLRLIEECNALCRHHDIHLRERVHNKAKSDTRRRLQDALDCVLGLIDAGSATDEDDWEAERVVQVINSCAELSRLHRLQWRERLQKAHSIQEAQSVETMLTECMDDTRQGSLQAALGCALAFIVAGLETDEEAEVV
jgi:hypothetical protein